MRAESRRVAVRRLNTDSAAGVDSTASTTRILILGGGFGGVYTARHLEHFASAVPDVEIVLVEPGQLPPHDAAAL